MEDIDGICYPIGPLIHRYRIESYTMRTNDIYVRPFAYKFDVFNVF